MPWASGGRRKARASRLPGAAAAAPENVGYNDVNHSFTSSYAPTHSPSIPMVRNNQKQLPRAARVRRAFLGSVLLLASCSAGFEDENVAPAPQGPTLTVQAQAVAASDLRAVVIGADSTIPQGTDLTEAYFLVSNYGMNISPTENGTASGLYELTAENGAIIFRVTEEVNSNGVRSRGSVGTHDTLLTLSSDEPVTGTLTITINGVSSSTGGSGWALFDIGNDGFGDLQTPHLHDSYQQTLTIDGTFEILATTFTNADPSASIVRVVTITFEP